MRELGIKSAGAARGLIGSVCDEFFASHRVKLSSDFAAVGTTFDRVSEAMRTNEDCGLTILTSAFFQRLQQAFPQRVAPGGSLGSTTTCFACGGDAGAFQVSTVDALRRTLSEVDAVYTGDTQQSTVGRHLIYVLEALDLRGELRPDIVEFPGGAQAVAALAGVQGKRVLAFAQRSEVLQIPEVLFVGPLPEAFRLATEYVLGVIDNAPAAKDFAAFLTAGVLESTRRESGFDPL